MFVKLNNLKLNKNWSWNAFLNWNILTKLSNIYLSRNIHGSFERYFEHCSPVFVYIFTKFTLSKIYYSPASHIEQSELAATFDLANTFPFIITFHAKALAPEDDTLDLSWMFQWQFLQWPIHLMIHLSTPAA